MDEKKTELLLFIPPPAIGHITSAVELAKQLITRDIRLSITFLFMKPPFDPSIISYMDTLASSTIGIHFIDVPQPTLLPSQESCQTLEGFASLYIERHKPQVKDIITKLVLSESNRVRLTGLVLDIFCSSMIDVANELGVPSYIFHTSPAAVLGLTLHLPTLHTQIATDFEDSGVSLVIPSYTESVPPYLLPTPLLNKDNDGYPWMLYHARRLKETKGIIVNSFMELEPYAFNSFTDSTIYPVGPLLNLKGKTGFRSDQTHDFNNKIMKWLDDQASSSVIFLCFGSMGSFGALQVQEIALGLERSGTQFLWVLREPPKTNLSMPNDHTNHDELLPDGFLDRTAGRGLVCGWVPQVVVLAHPAIGGFVSHCGWNSILEGLWYGVPILTWPLYAEQKLNAFQMVKELGLAVELRLCYGGDGDLVKAEEVERGVRCLMEEESEVRRNVNGMKEECRKAMMDGGSSFISMGRLIEDMIGKINMAPIDEIS